MLNLLLLVIFASLAFQYKFENHVRLLGLIINCIGIYLLYHSLSNPAVSLIMGAIILYTIYIAENPTISYESSVSNGSSIKVMNEMQLYILKLCLKSALFILFVAITVIQGAV